MGDRALVTFKDENGLTPAVYLHWNGSDVQHLLEKAAPNLRFGDASYSAARFCGFCHMQLPGVTGLGIIAAPPDEPDWDKYSHGDAGVFVVDVCSGEVETHAGYGKPFKIDAARFGR